MGGGCAFCRWKRLLCAWRRALYVWKRRCADVRAGTQAPPLPFLMWLRVIKLPKNSSPRHKYKCIVVANSSPHHKHECIVVANSSPHHKHKCIVVANSSPRHKHECIVVANSSLRHKHKCIVVANSSLRHKHKCIVAANSLPHHKHKCIVVARCSLADEIEKRLLARACRWRRGCFPTFLMGVFPQTSLVFTEKALTLQPYLMR